MKCAPFQVGHPALRRASIRGIRSRFGIADSVSAALGFFATFSSYYKCMSQSCCGEEKRINPVRKLPQVVVGQWRVAIVGRESGALAPSPRSPSAGPRQVRRIEDHPGLPYAEIAAFMADLRQQNQRLVKRRDLWRFSVNAGGAVIGSSGWGSGPSPGRVRTARLRREQSFDSS
jgi:hypothetical protein